MPSESTGGEVERLCLGTEVNGSERGIIWGDVIAALDPTVASEGAARLDPDEAEPRRVENAEAAMAVAVEVNTTRGTTGDDRGSRRAVEAVVVALCSVGEALSEERSAARSKDGEREGEGLRRPVERG